MNQQGKTEPQSKRGKKKRKKKVLAMGAEWNLSRGGVFTVGRELGWWGGDI